MSEAHPATPEQPASGGEQSAAAASPAVPNTPSPPATPAASGDQPTAPTAPAASASASASSETFARLVERLGRSGGQHVHATLLPERPGTSGEWPQWVHPRIVDAWRARGAELPWLHQRRALDAIREGNDCVIATGTGSGKSLLAWTPILSDLASAEQSTRISEVHRTPTCLYIAPTKALAADQLNALNTLLAAIPDVEGIHVGAADGDTPREAKDWARAYASIIVTNPDYVHHVLLPGHERWTRFLSSLRYIVIDELHQWRGVSGSHIALVIRRLLRIAHLLGASPQVIMMSATVRDPHRVGTQMVGRDRLVAISEDTSPSGAHHIVLWQGREIPRDEDIPIDAFLRALAQAEAGEEAVLEAPMTRISAQTEAAQLTAALVESGARLLTFVRSRGGAETVAAQVRERLVASPEHARAVAAYRGGFLPEERRALEQALRSGALRAVATTSALELGIDISGLDATITAGWPGTKASFWQQAGRAGRAGNTGISVLIASDNPLDSYLVHHPEELFGEVEAAVIDPSNPWVLAPHLCAAAAEHPLNMEEVREIFGDAACEVVASLTDERYLRRRGSLWFWDVTREERPSDLADLRGGGHDVQIIDVHSGGVIGSVSDSAADAQVFPDAIYVHQGRTFHVLSLESLMAPERGAGSGGGAGEGVLPEPSASRAPHALQLRAPSHPRVALVEEVRTPLRTRAGQHVSIDVVSDDEQWVSADGTVTWHRGVVDVTSQVTDFDLLRLPHLEFISNRELSLAPQTLRTHATWVTFSPATLRAIGITPDDEAGALHAAEHASIALLPLLATCDRWDLGGLSTQLHADTALPTIFVHDAYRGGAGYSHYGFSHASQWVSMTAEALESCECSSGCPRCVQSPKCGNGNEPLSKTGALALLRYLETRSPAARHS